MAERKTDDSFNPRHRIVGAVILVALAVIFLPLLLQDRPPDKESAEQKDVAVPPDTNTKPRADVPRPAGAEPATTRPATRTVTVALDPADITKPIKKPLADPVTTVEPSKAEPKPEPVAPKAEPKTTAKPESKPESKTRAKTESTGESRNSGWYVQVGVFSQADNARRLQEKLVAKGFHVVTDPPRIEKGKIIKVEVGPYHDQPAARTAAARIKTEHGIDGVVRNH